MKLPISHLPRIYLAVTIVSSYILNIRGIFSALGSLKSGSAMRRICARSLRATEFSREFNRKQAPKHTLVPSNL